MTMIVTWAPLSPGSRYFVATEMFIEGLFDVIVMLGGWFDQITMITVVTFWMKMILWNDNDKGGEDKDDEDVHDDW